MPRRTTFKLPGLRTWVDNIKNETSREATRQIVTDLKIIGPWYTGEFEKNWEVRLGDVRIPGDKQPGSERAKTSNTSPTPIPGGVPPVKGRKSATYTIGNRMNYRDIAMDLVPEGDPNRREGRTIRSTGLVQNLR